MGDTIRRIDYYYIMALDKPGEGARVLGVCRNAGVNLLAVHAFPSARRTQIDLVPADGAAFLAAAKGAKLKVSKPKSVFLVDGDDRVGAMAHLLGRLGTARINVVASEGICTGGGRFGALIWVKPRDVKKAAEVLGAM